MDIKINIDSLIDTNNKKVDTIKFQKMILLYNAMEDGWSIKKKNDAYIFSKNHEGKKEILDESYLSRFMNVNFDINKILI
jgi:hypothetical protein